MPYGVSAAGCTARESEEAPRKYNKIVQYVRFACNFAYLLKLQMRKLKSFLKDICLYSGYLKKHKKGANAARSTVVLSVCVS